MRSEVENQAKDEHESSLSVRVAVWTALSVPIVLISAMWGLLSIQSPIAYLMFELALVATPIGILIGMVSVLRGWLRRKEAGAAFGLVLAYGFWLLLSVGVLQVPGGEGVRGRPATWPPP